ncbi:MAG: hypothetical protein JNL52_05950 [Flavobacteriales bacterium]|nr:hypothetical protein [Flavobacteriales bacterium]
MALLESAVVIYIRALYYPAGFHFPLVPMDANLVVTEVCREVATMVMLWTVAAMLASRALERFAWFCIGFGIWDLGYYAWLKVLIDWPSTIFDSDLLFLLPLPWVGPVWAPCFISIGLIVVGLIIIAARSRDATWKISASIWWLLGLSVLVFLVSFMMDPFTQGIRTGSFVRSVQTPSSSMSAVIDSYVPGPFSWGWFLLGSVLGLVAVVRSYRSLAGLSKGIVEK